MNNILMEIAELGDQNLTKDDQWCLIDDRTDMIPGQSFFEINWEVELTNEDTEKATNYFSDSNSIK